MKFIIYFIFSICLYFPSLSYSLTFKSDGTVIKSDGSYLKEPPFLNFQKALNGYLNGEQMPEDWPVVELDEEGNPKKVKGYFGEKILEEGAPLFSIPKSIGGNVMQDLALQNGLFEDQLGAILVSNSKQQWREESEIDEGIYTQSKKYSSYLAKSDYMGFKIEEISKTYIKYEQTKKEAQLFLIQNPDDDIAKIEYQREIDSKVADISNKLNEYFEFGKRESLELLGELSVKYKALTNDYNNEEMIDILQLELLNNLEEESDIDIDDLNYAQGKVDAIIEEKKNNNEDWASSTVLIQEISTRSKIIDVTKNIEEYKALFNEAGFNQSNMLSEDWIEAVKSMEEYPGAIFQKFNTLASLQEDFEDFNEIAEEFKKSTENAIGLADPLGQGDVARGLLMNRWNDLQNQMGLMNINGTYKDITVGVYDTNGNFIPLGPGKELILNDEERELRNSIQNEIDQISQELQLEENLREIIDSIDNEVDQISQELQAQQAEDERYSECVDNSAPGDEGDC
jgi:hypothetical protein